MKRLKFIFEHNLTRSHLFVTPNPNKYRVAQLPRSHTNNIHHMPSSPARSAQQCADDIRQQFAATVRFHAATVAAQQRRPGSRSAATTGQQPTARCDHPANLGARRFVVGLERRIGVFSNTYIFFNFIRTLRGAYTSYSITYTQHTLLTCFCVCFFVFGFFGLLLRAEYACCVFCAACLRALRCAFVLHARVSDIVVEKFFGALRAVSLMNAFISRRRTYI